MQQSSRFRLSAASARPPRSIVSVPHAAIFCAVPARRRNQVSKCASSDTLSERSRSREKWESIASHDAGAAAVEEVKRVPSAEHLRMWQNADAVCFDVDCTCVCNDGLDILAEFMGVSSEVEAITSKAMDGTMSLDIALEERLKIINCTPNDVKAFLKAHPPESRMNPGIAKLIKALQSRGIQVYLISGGFREILIPIAKYLGVPYANVFANRMNWQWDDETGEPTKLVGFDMSEPTARNQGKPEAIADIRKNYPYNNVVMVGDGITDLEAVQVTGGADLFIGYGGNVARPAVMAQADWFVYHHDELTAALKRRKVAMVGSGSWASAAVHMLAQNIATGGLYSDEFDPEVKMWVYAEDYEGQKLHDVINEKHQNPKYLPGVELGANVIATSDLADCVKGADVLVFCAPHQFIKGICNQLVGKVREDAIAISLTKGMRVRTDGPQLISQMINKALNIDCSVLMGANVAANIGKEELSEATIGYYKRDNAKVFQKLFERDYFHVNIIPDAPGAEMCGTLKNVVALAAGIIDGLGLGPNSKAAIMRQGLSEIMKFSKALYPSVRDETFMESCGMADLIATCIGGRNRLCAEEWVKATLAGSPKTFDELEKELLDGSKLQGTLTTDEVYAIIKMKGWETEYPLFTTTYRVVKGLIPPQMVGNFKEGARMKVEDSPAATGRRNPLPSLDD